MLKRPTQKTLSAEEMSQVVAASREQSTANTIVKSYDPNFPAFTIPVNKKILVYVPNFTITNPDGSVSIRADRACYHAVRDGRAYGFVRCSRDVTLPSLNLDGSCPFCDAESEVLELFFKQREDIAKKKGINVKAPEAKELLKEDTQKLSSQKAVGQKVAKLTFPIVVIDTEDGTTKPKLVDGKLSGKIYWYTIAEDSYTDKWIKALDSLTDADGNTPTNPAGLWTILNYKYTDKDNEANARDSARKLIVSYAIAMQEPYKDWAKFYDQQAEEWTPAKAIETLVDNQLRSMDEMVEACDTVMRSTRDTLALYQQASLGGSDLNAQAQIGVAGNANAVLESFGATPAQTGALPTTGAQPPIGIQTNDTANVGVGVPQAPIGG